MNHRYFFIPLLTLTLFACGQNSTTNSSTPESCDSCKAYEEYGQKRLTHIDTLSEFAESEPKILLTGNVYKKDGETPAKNVIIYIYHTDRGGIYPKRGNETGFARQHGYLRGWVKTNHKGEYAFYTFRPGAYPSRGAPEHVHVTIKEPNKTEYYIDDFFFEDDPLLTDRFKNSLSERGGSGVVSLKRSGDLYIAKRDIILGKNIPNY